MDTAYQTEKLTKEAKRSMQEGRKKVDQFSEEASSLVPSWLFVGAALASIGFSAFLQSRKSYEGSLFVGQWAPTFMLFAIYNKVVKRFGGD